MLTPEHWKQVKALFEHALEQGPTDVSAWLDNQRVADERVRAEVLSLLRHHSQSGSFLIDPIADRMPDLMADDHRFQPGQVVGKYTIVRRIDRGGMGGVYLATDNQLKRPVALKALLPELATDPSYRERLRREAQALANLNDPGICTIHALEEIDGELFLVFEFLDGQTLRVEMNAKERPTAAAVERTARDLASALSSAHRLEITHRDLKPENIIRTSDGRLKILDFGLALVKSPDSVPLSMKGTLTIPGAIIGTPAYMAPEQLQGQRADHRTDVFALGVLLYEYASGIHPFHAEGVLAVISRILESDPVPLDRLRPDLPRSLVAVITRCLRKPRSDRFRSAVDIVEALNRVEIVRSATPVTWWRTHQLAVIGLYFVACALAWQAKEWRPGAATAVFFAIGLAATVGGFFRGHLLFTERVNGGGLDVERQRASSVTIATDLAVALALVVDGGLLAFGRPVPAVLTIALGVGTALARLVIEPATTSATFAQPESG